MLKLGLDLGSTTVKAVIIDEDGIIKFKKYVRHYSKIASTVLNVLKEVESFCSDRLEFAMSGSAGIGLASQIEADFIQEVFATKNALNKLDLDADVAIELGGEDAKILFLKKVNEVRMNGTCAGGTGAFIDQMAVLLGVTPDELNELSKNAQKTYPIASRCGVFAKTDIQPLINQGADKSDLSKSILYAIVNQTIAGLAQGRKIQGKVVYLGGPLTFLSGLRDCFDEVLNIKGELKEDSLYFVAIGAALSAKKQYSVSELIEKISKCKSTKAFNSLSPLFNSQLEYDEFKLRHNKEQIKKGDISKYSGKAYIGVDSGSTTIKMVIIGENEEILDYRYLNNDKNPALTVKDYLIEIYEKYPDLSLVSGAATGYGEDLIVSAFDFGAGIVETTAHFLAAKKMMPNVSFVIDIGGQDMKCFKIIDGAIDDIFLNEACSSGCGSFLKTFADTLNYGVEEFCNLALFAPSPVDLGSRCTVFMNSSVKQAQKDGASVENISAGLAVSVVKNALYKVIRVKDKEELGKNIVVQGGTFLSDAVLRAFEKELKVNVIRPSLAGLMGAYGAALYIKELNKEKIISYNDLKSFKYEVKNIRCGRCSNNCVLSIINFNNKRKYISGNKCERPNKEVSDELNIFSYKLKKLNEYVDKRNDNAFRGDMGIPFVLNMFELLPFWHTFFTQLGFNVITSPLSDSGTFKKGQAEIPSDTVCFPAKLVHGHIQSLLDLGLTNIFYPSLSYNFNEKISNNHFNCPVVAYYPEVVGISIDKSKINFIECFVDLNNKSFLCKRIYDYLIKYFPDITLNEVKKAVKLASKQDSAYLNDLKRKGSEIINKARELNRDIVVLAGRPYHADPEVNKGIPQLIAGFERAVVSEDCLPLKKPLTSVLNQWTYHARLYSAADLVTKNKDMSLIQLVSFGCGLDAVTSDEIKSRLNKKGKLYTQLKIDEITNLGAVKIRLKSLFAALRK